MTKNFARLLLLGSAMAAQIQVPGFNAGATPSTIDIGTCATFDTSRTCDDFTYILAPPGYQVSKIDIWEVGGNEFEAIQLTFSSTCGGGGPDIVSTKLGLQNGVGSGVSYPITKPVVGVTSNMDLSQTKTPQYFFTFTYSDGTTLKAGQDPGGTTGYYSPMEANFLGFKCNFRQKSGACGGGVTCYDRCYGCIPFTETCSGLTFDAFTVNNMSIVVGGTATQAVDLTIGCTVGCGARTYTLTPNYSFLTHTGNLGFYTGNVLTLTTVNPSDANTYLVTLDVTVSADPTYPHFSQSFTVTIVCTVTSMTWDPVTPATTTYRIDVDPQPVIIPFSVTKTPNCLTAPTFTVTSDIPLPPMSFGPTALNAGEIQLNGILKAHINTYTLTITCVQDVTITKTITVIIWNPCGVANTQTVPPIANMPILTPSAVITPQTYTITTDQTLLDATVICNLSASLGPAVLPPYISLSPDGQTISVDASQISLPSDIGPHTFTLTIVSVDNFLTVSDLPINFDVIITCTVSSFTVVTAPAANTNYVLNDPSVTTAPLDLIQNSNCQLPYTYSYSFMKNGVGITQPGWLNFFNPTRTFSFFVTAPADVGVYTVTLVAATSQISHTEVFTITVIHDCTLTSITDRAFNNMLTYVSGALDSQTLVFDDYIGVTVHSDITYCGPRAYSLSLVLPFLSISGDTLVLSTTNPGHVSVTMVQVTISLQNWPGITLTKTFQVTVICQVQTLVFNISPPIYQLFQLGIDAQPVVIPYSVTKFPLCAQTTTFTFTGPGFVTESSLNDAGTLTISGVVASDVNLYPSSLRADLDGLTVTAPIDIEIQCIVTSFLVSQMPANQSYKIQTPSVTTITYDVLQQYDCLLPQTLSSSVTWNGVPQPVLPPGLIFDPISRTYTFNFNQIWDMGDYDITTTVTIPQIDPVTGLNKFDSKTFTLTVIANCDLTYFIDRDFYNMETVIFGTAVTQNLFLNDAYSLYYNNPIICNARRYTVEPNHSFLSFVGDTLTLSSNALDDQGVYEITIDIAMLLYPTVFHVSHFMTITIRCEITEIKPSLLLPGIIPQRILVDPIAVNLFEFSIRPQCNVNYQINPWVDFTAYTDRPTDYTRAMYIAGTQLSQTGWYDMNITVSPAAPNFGVQGSMNFKVHLINACQTAEFLPITFANIEVLLQSDQYSQRQFQTFSDFQYSPLKRYGLDCGPIKTRSVQVKNMLDTPGWISIFNNGNSTVSSNTVQVDFWQTSQPQTIEAALYSFLIDYPKSSIIVPFNVTLASVKITCAPATPLTYRLGDPALVFSPPFIDGTFGSKEFLSTLTRINQPFIRSQGKNTQKEMITYSQNFVVQGNEFASIGDWQVGLRLGYEEYPSEQVTCWTPLTIVYDSLEIGDYLSDQTIVAGANFTLDLSNFIQAFGKDSNITVDLGEAAQFLAFDPVSQTVGLKVDPSLLADYISNTVVILTSTDKSGAQAHYTFNLDVTTPKAQKQASEASKKRQPPPRPYIIDVNQFGHLRVGFTRPIVVPTIDKYSEFKLDEFFSHNCTNGGRCEKGRRLNQTTNDTQAVDIVNRGKIWVNNTQEPVVKLTTVPGEMSDKPRLDFTWNCTKVTSTYMDFKLSYEYIPDVSFFYDFKESIKVDFIGKRYFPAADDGQVFQTDEQVVSKFVPQQIDETTASGLTRMASSFSGLGKALIIAVFFFWFQIGGDLSRLLRAIIKIQIMLHLFITNVPIPANASIYAASLLPMVTYNYFSFPDSLRASLQISESQNLAVNFDNLGYHSVFYLININHLIVFIAFTLSALAFVYLAKRSENIQVQRLRTSMEAAMIWNFVLQAVDQTLIVYTVSCFMQLKWTSSKEVGETICWIFAMLSLIGIVSSLVANFKIMRRNKIKFKSETFHSRFSTLFDDLNWRWNYSQILLLEPFLSQLRIVLLCTSLIFLEEFPYWQLFITNGLGVLVVMYHHMWNSILKERDQRVMEVINEGFIALVNYHMISFKMLELNKETRWLVGKWVIGFITLAIIVNLVHIGITTGLPAYRKYKILYLLWKRNKLREDQHLRELERLERERLALEQEMAFKRKNELILTNTPIYAIPVDDPRIESPFEQSVDSDAGIWVVQGTQTILEQQRNRKRKHRRQKTRDDNKDRQIRRKPSDSENIQPQDYPPEYEDEPQYPMTTVRVSNMHHVPLDPRKVRVDQGDLWGHFVQDRVPSRNNRTDTIDMLVGPQSIKQDMFERVIRRQEYADDDLHFAYVQPAEADLGEPISQLERVVKRRMKSSHQFTDLTTTRQKFDDLWGHHN